MAKWHIFDKTVNKFGDRMINQLLDEVESRKYRRADQLFAKALLMTHS